MAVWIIAGVAGFAYEMYDISKPKSYSQKARDVSALGQTAVYDVGGSHMSGFETVYVATKTSHPMKMEAQTAISVTASLPSTVSPSAAAATPSDVLPPSALLPRIFVPFNINATAEDIVKANSTAINEQMSSIMSDLAVYLLKEYNITDGPANAPVHPSNNITADFLQHHHLGVWSRQTDDPTTNTASGVTLPGGGSIMRHTLADPSTGPGLGPRQPLGVADSALEPDQDPDNLTDEWTSRTIDIDPRLSNDPVVDPDSAEEFLGPESAQELLQPEVTESKDAEDLATTTFEKRGGDTVQLDIDFLPDFPNPILVPDTPMGSIENPTTTDEHDSAFEPNIHPSDLHKTNGPPVPIVPDNLPPQQPHMILFTRRSATFTSESGTVIVGSIITPSLDLASNKELSVRYGELVARGVVRGEVISSEDVQWIWEASAPVPSNSNLQLTTANDYSVMPLGNHSSEEA